VRLRVPNLRRLPFESAIVERYKRRESCVEEALVEMYLAGVSVRRVEDITEALWGTRVSSGTVSRLNQKIYRHIEAWRNRLLCGIDQQIHQHVTPLAPFGRGDVSKSRRGEHQCRVSVRGNAPTTRVRLRISRMILPVDCWSGSVASGVEG
jgi:Transposase, Mutator family